VTTPAEQPLPEEPRPEETRSEVPLAEGALGGGAFQEAQPQEALQEETVHNASEEFDVDLEQANDGPLKAATRWVVGLVDAALGGDGSDVMGATAVVRRIDNDAEVLRVTGYNIDEAEGLVALLRKDLAELTREEFLEKWAASNGVETSL